MSKMKFCPDCTSKMDTITSGGKEYHACGNKECISHVDPFDRYEDKRMDSLDIEQEIREGLDHE